MPVSGGEGGNETTFTVEAGHWLGVQEVYDGDYVDSLELHTQEYVPRSRMGSASKYAFGGSGGELYWRCGLTDEQDVNPFSDDSPMIELAGIHGRSGDLLDAIGFWYRTIYVRP